MNRNRDYLNLFGAWQLVEYSVNAPGSTQIKFPFGHDAQGLIVYSDTHMSVQIMRRDHQLQDNGPSKENLAAPALTGFMAYAGAYTLDFYNSLVTHHVEHSSNPNWIGTYQSRHFTFKGNLLTLQTAEPLLIDGEYVNAALTWRKL